MPNYSKVEFAVLYATEWHAGQKRKYNGVPYIFHPIEVATIVGTVCTDEDVLCAAICHDVLEDTPTTYNILATNLGVRVADFVVELTDIKDKAKNRATRNAESNIRLANASAEAQTIKCADLISNTRDICHFDKDFAKVYLTEKRNTLKVLSKSNNQLWLQAYALAVGYADDELCKIAHARIRGNDYAPSNAEPDDSRGY